MRLPPSLCRCVASPDKQENPEAKNMTPRYVNPMQWQQAMGYARQACARIFRDAGNRLEHRRRPHRAVAVRLRPAQGGVTRCQFLPVH
jgi:hypothetical protein